MTFHELCFLHLKVPNVFLCCHRRTRTPLPIRFKYMDRYQYGLYAKQPALIRDAALESARLAIIRATKTKDLFMVKADIPVTRKPVGSRMGKGKGKLDHYLANVMAGKVIFEFNCDNETQAMEGMKQATYKLPVRTQVRIKPSGKKEIWTDF